MLTHLTHRLAGVAAATVAGIGATVGLAAPAQALVLNVVTCTGEQEITLTPGARNEPQVITVESNTTYHSCTSTGNTVTKGAYHFTVMGEFPCLSLPEAGPRSRTITWNDGEASSTIDFTSVTARTAGGQFIVERFGTVAAGLFTGDVAKETIVGMTLDPAACASPEGLTSATSGTTLVITGLL